MCAAFFPPLVVNAVAEDDGESSEEDLPANKVYLARSNALESMSDADLYKMFRFDREGILIGNIHCSRDISQYKIQYICGIVREQIEPRGGGRGGAISVELQVLATLGYLASNSFQLWCGHLLGMSQQTISRCVRRVTSALREVAGNFIYFLPYEQARNIVTPGFANIAGFPGVVGAIDGTHIRILPPAEYEKAYINRKGFPSINVQGIVDHNGRFLNISACWPGSSHDAFVLRQSNVWEEFESGRMEGILLGDSAYPTRRWIMTPFANVQNVAQQRYNYAHSKTRVVVENAFGRWKRRFHILHSTIRIKLENVPTLILAAAVLHNIALERKLAEFDDDELEDEQPGPAAENINLQDDSFALRNNIAQNFFGGDD